MSPSIGIIRHIDHGSVCVAHLKRRFGKWARRDQSRALRVPDSLSSPMTAVRPVSRQRSSLVNPSAALDTLQARVEYLADGSSKPDHSGNLTGQDGLVQRLAV